ncbi:MAG: EI24 domain-containing protein [Alphaproteobacteria bacterium]|nr:EI24 domain-containing protein [Alphaproteobacteria bacterium]
MIDGFLKALKQLSDPRLKGVLWMGALGALSLEIALWALLWWGLSFLRLFEWAWLDASLDVGLLLVVMIASLWFFPVLSTLIVGFFLERVARAVEERHYPGLPAAREVGLGESLFTALRFGLVSLGLNLLVLPLYFIPLLNLGVFLLLNGYLLGREYFELVGSRRLEPGPLAVKRLGHRGRLLLVGMAGAALMAVPLVNLAVPVLLTAWMVHVAQSLPD